MGSGIGNLIQGATGGGPLSSIAGNVMKAKPASAMGMANNLLSAAPAGDMSGLAKMLLQSSVLQGGQDASLGFGGPEPMLRGMVGAAGGMAPGQGSPNDFMAQIQRGGSGAPMLGGGGSTGNDALMRLLRSRGLLGGMWGG